MAEHSKWGDLEHKSTPEQMERARAELDHMRRARQQAFLDAMVRSWWRRIAATATRRPPS